jgi:hypothetical protein
MAREPRINSVNVVKSFRKIGGSIDPHTDPKLGELMVRLVRDKDALARFRKAPEKELAAAGVDAKLIKPKVLETVVVSLADRLSRLRPGGDIMDTVSTKETSSHQERNFDHSSSWFANKDGYNVIYDAGHSAEKSSGEMVGQDKKFDGLELGDFEHVIRQELAALFYPAQPLVTPQLVDQIKAAVKGIER